MIELFDTHFHPAADFEAADIAGKLPSDRYRIYMMAVGGGMEESLTARRFAESCPDAWFACGVHPHGAENFDGDIARWIATFSGDPGLKAVGELGLDYFYDFSPRQAQRDAFQAFLEMALELDLPAVVHIRDREGREDAYLDALRLLEPFAKRGGRMVIHCFAGSREWAFRFLELGAMLGATGMATFRRAENIRSVLKEVPMERLLIETDSPYLAPVPLRGTENHPGNLPVIAEFLAGMYGMPLEEFAARTTGNAFRFYRI